MTTIARALKHIEKFALDNSPAILTTLGVVGAVSTAVFAGTAGYKMHALVQAENDRLRAQAHYDRHSENFDVLTWREEFQLTWTKFIPSAASLALTVAATIGANQIGGRRAAAVAAAFAISEKGFTEYKEKVAEQLGAKKEKALRDDLAQDRVMSTPGSNEVVIVSGQVLCFDQFSGRYFNSDMETIKKAQNDINYTIMNDMYASLSDFYDKIGLTTTSYSEEVGWNVDVKLELIISSTLSDDSRPCIAIDFRTVPVRDYWRLH